MNYDVYESFIDSFNNHEKKQELLKYNSFYCLAIANVEKKAT